MEMLLFSVLFIFVLAISVLGHWLDKKHNLQLARWLNCEVPSPFKDSHSTSDTASRHQATAHQETVYKPTAPEQSQYEELKKRVEVLEKLVTDPAWELNAKINNLK